jgi:hypothetical protein
LLSSVKKRFLSGWTFVRALFTGVGLTLVIQALFGGHWMALVIGAYFALMGLLNVGCASGGGCYGSFCEPSAGDTTQKPPAQIKFEEIKTTNS